jgi:acid stress-induced BolA-like protein IbaG/YrbA|tara:strand:- start:540 stop:797 length:258 start_codon:yes stop_codon:yes gene_type:complete
MIDKEKTIMINFDDIDMYLTVKQSSLNFYVALVSIFSMGKESIERAQSVDSEIFNCYEHARRHALSMIRKHGAFENTVFKGDSMN